jgi:hypothetical protein
MLKSVISLDWIFRVFLEGDETIFVLPDELKCDEEVRYSIASESNQQCSLGKF